METLIPYNGSTNETFLRHLGSPHNVNSIASGAHACTKRAVLRLVRKLQETFMETSDGTSVYYVIYLMSLAFCIPIIRWVYATFISRFVALATAKAKELSQRMSDRLSDVGRKVSDQMLRK